MGGLVDPSRVSEAGEEFAMNFNDYDSDSDQEDESRYKYYCNSTYDYTMLL